MARVFPPGYRNGETFVVLAIGIGTAELCSESIFYAEYRKNEYRFFTHFLIVRPLDNEIYIL